jgi:uncharacterized membrane protein YfcA
MTQEVRLFGAMSTFGIVIGFVYWFLTYDWTGTVLLVLFGVAAGVAAIAELVSSRRRRRAADRLDRPAEAGPAARETTGMALGAAGTAEAIATVAAEAEEQLPRPGWAPLGLALGLGAVALGAAFGPAIAVAGLLLTLWAARSWLAATVRESRDGHRDEGAAPHRSPTGRSET